MRKRDHNVLTNAASLLICGLLAGVVVAAAAFPAVAMSGLAAKAGAETFDKLPSELVVKLAPQASRVLANDGKTLLAMMWDEYRLDVKLKDMGPLVPKAIVAAEDHNFYKHNGVDFKGIGRAFVNNSSGAASQQGASTLTMQYVRLAISYSATHPADVVAATEDTKGRKIREMRLALKVDQELSKDEILERYLNIAYFGNGAYGIYAASQVYFGKQPKDLTIEEAALLAGMVKAPTSFNPVYKTGYDQALVRRNYVINDMVDIGAITKADGEKAKAVELKVKNKRAANGCASTSVNDWGFFCDYFYRWWLEQETFGSTTYDRERRLKSGGYTIITTLDPKVQASAMKAVTRSQKIGSKLAVMVAAVEPGTGYVRAVAMNRKFKLDDPSNPENKPSSDPKKRAKGIRGTYPNTTNPLVTGGGDVVGYQAGSTFKMFTMVAALEKGYPLSYSINAPVQFKSEYRIDPSNPASCGGGYYCPTNAVASMAGTHNMWTGFGASVNTYFVPLEQKVGAANVVDVAKRLGIKFRSSYEAGIADNRELANTWGAFTLGVSATTPLDLANSYATLAADGLHCETIPVQEIRDPSGATLDVAKPRCNKAVDVDVARAAVDAGRCPVGDHSASSRCKGATASNVRGAVGKPVFGKTGTTDSERSAAMVVSARQLSVAGIETDPDWALTNEKMQHNAQGGINAPVYETLRDALKGKESKEFLPPGAKSSEGNLKRIPDVRCASVESARSRIKDAGFDVQVASQQVNSNCPAGSVAGTNPDNRAPDGSTVTLEISNGGGGGNNTGGNTGGNPPPGNGNGGGPRPRR